MGGMLPTAAMTAVQLGMESAQRDTARDQAKAEARAQTLQVQQTQAVQSRERAEQLRRALATQRARFGAQGLSAGSGSAAAALGGLAAESERQDQDASSLAALRASRIGDDLEWQQRRSLLDASSSRYRSAFSLMQQGLRSASLLGD
ncbi:MAG: hypothetical protein JNM48_15780 [Rhodospirillales bacterium]|nr:hypothetical protein [Rhodospirillales bacterium]